MTDGGGSRPGRITRGSALRLRLALAFISVALAAIALLAGLTAAFAAADVSALADRQHAELTSAIAVAAAALAALLAMVTGLAVARRITRPVERIIVVTRAMGRGQRTARVDQIAASGELPGSPPTRCHASSTGSGAAARRSGPPAAASALPSPPSSPARTAGSCPPAAS